MANEDFVFNISKGKAGYYATLPAASDALVVVLLKLSGLETDSTLKDYDTLSAILAASNDECDFTNYVRKSITSVTNTVDDTNDYLTSTFASQTWTTAGGATNNDVGKLLVCYDNDTGAGTDANIVPLTAHAFVVTTDASDLPARITTGFYRAV